MNEIPQIVVTGVGPALPGVAGVQDLVTGPSVPAEPVDPAALLGKKGLKYKDRATRLGLSAASLGLQDAGLRNAEGPLVPPRGVGCVVASNYGNADTICRVVTTIAEETTRGTSPMDSPNASSNIIASEVAIRFGLQGPNMTVCNGDSSGLDALHWAASLLRSARADQVLVIGVEPDNEMVRRLVRTDRLVDGAVALVLESATTAEERGVKARAVWGGYARTGGVERTAHRLDRFGAGSPAAWYAPEEPGDGTPRAEHPRSGLVRHDMSAVRGTLSAALGTAQCAAAVARFDAGESGPVHLMAGRVDDGVAGALLLAPGDAS
ncbi:beta-ketoacyl synthase N-terminal-like domain-containing protein [Streptomyces sp. TR06-5]|uniref:beta-ketoacyl synthase N-terminal-like domain-containing protein n=1 Tax=Streptomyces sp. TR06-5 TaxID=3385976 RepID=UPI00399F853C